MLSRVKVKTTLGPFSQNMFLNSTALLLFHCFLCKHYMAVFDLWVHFCHFVPSRPWHSILKTRIDFKKKKKRNHAFLNVKKRSVWLASYKNAFDHCVLLLFQDLACECHIFKMLCQDIGLFSQKAFCIPPHFFSIVFLSKHTRWMRLRLVSFAFYKRCIQVKICSTFRQKHLKKDL